MNVENLIATANITGHESLSAEEVFQRCLEQGDQCVRDLVKVPVSGIKNTAIQALATEYLSNKPIEEYEIVTTMYIHKEILHKTMVMNKSALITALDIICILDRAITKLSTGKYSMGKYNGKKVILDGSLQESVYDDDNLYVCYVDAYNLFQHGNLHTVVSSDVNEFINAYMTSADKVNALAHRNMFCASISPYLSVSPLSYDSLLDELPPGII